jgi:hypothetical protein
MKISNFQMRSFAALDLISMMVVRPDRQGQFPIFTHHPTVCVATCTLLLCVRGDDCGSRYTLAGELSRNFSKKIFKKNFENFTKSKMYMNQNRRKGVLLLAPGGT